MSEAIPAARQRRSRAGVFGANLGDHRRSAFTARPAAFSVILCKFFLIEFISFLIAGSIIAISTPGVNFIGVIGNGLLDR